ncbi:MAG: acetylxylan esterase [Mycolicibacterium neoaurum]|uniref:alpha/beta hydrolase n=1 Tax=Mycolicibacterium neoaurum TaxID=1795 RepID=UPI002FFC3A31
MKIEQDTLVVDGVACAATWTIPDQDSNRLLPTVFSASGFAGVKEMIMPDYHRDLAERGIMSLTFDYAGFGESAGHPRQQVDPPQQFRAFRAALDVLAANPRVDGSRIGVWGTSLSGGHALKIAATDSRIAAVAAVIPFIYLTPTANIQLAPVLIKDTVLRLFGREGKFQRPAGRGRSRR